MGKIISNNLPRYLVYTHVIKGSKWELNIDVICLFVDIMT